MISCGGSNELNCDQSETADPVVGTWSCIDNSGDNGTLQFSSNQIFFDTGLITNNNFINTWLNNYNNNYTINTIQSTQVTINFESNNKFVLIHPNPFIGYINCNRTACTNDAVNPILGEWACLDQYNINGTIIFNNDGTFEQSNTSFYNGTPLTWEHIIGEFFIFSGNNGNQNISIGFTGENSILILPIDVELNQIVNTHECTRI